LRFWASSHRHPAAHTAVFLRHAGRLSSGLRDGRGAIRPNFDLIDKRFADHLWWYGDRWSIVDAYVNWVWFRVTGTKFDGSTYPNLRRHDAEMQQRPAVKRAFAISTEVAEGLAAQGLAVKFTEPGFSFSIKG